MDYTARSEILLGFALEWGGAMRCRRLQPPLFPTEYSSAPAISFICFGGNSTLEP